MGETTVTALQIDAPAGIPEVTFSREFDAPRERVWRAMTDPELVARWWGPRGMGTKIEIFEPQFGGRLRIVHVAPDGAEFGFRGVFHDVVENERATRTFEWDGTPGHILLETMRLEEKDGRTILSGQSVYQSLSDRDGMVASGMEGGMRDSMDRLEELLADLR